MASALESGTISYLQAMNLAEAVYPLDTETTAAVERRVYWDAPRYTLAEFQRSLRRAVPASATSDRAKQQRAEAMVERRVCVTPRDDGMAELWALLPAEGAAALHAAVDALASVTSADYLRMGRPAPRRRPRRPRRRRAARPAAAQGTRHAPSHPGHRRAVHSARPGRPTRRTRRTRPHPRRASPATSPPTHQHLVVALSSTPPPAPPSTTAPPRTGPPRPRKTTSSPATKPARSPAADERPTAANSTTSSPPPQVAPPASTTSPPSAVGTTARKHQALAPASSAQPRHTSQSHSTSPTGHTDLPPVGRTRGYAA